MTARTLTALLTLTVLLGCSSGSGGRPTVLKGAPEPARAPEPTTAPVGTVVDLHGGRPEGIVADPVSGLVAVAVRDPSRVLLVDVRARRVVKSVLVPGSARHLELVSGGGAVLVPGEDTNLVARVELPSGHLSSQVAVLRQPHDVAVTTSRTLYVADEFGGAVTVVRGSTVIGSLLGLVQPGGAAGTGDTGVVVDVRARLLHVYRDGREVAALPAGAGPTHALALVTGQVLVTDTTGGALLRYDVGSDHPHLLDSTPLAGRPYGTAYDARRHRVFITATASNALVEYAEHDGRLTRMAQFPTVRDAYSVAVDDASGRAVVAGESGSQLQFIDP